ncbi:M20 family peptidase [Pontibacter cellulosilyticus]|uniref:M20/M25/M40 family metallo-hydrolase n=1 Tax=Pontibacter cellulosilyticus TaxID=1720253 RepID=A0A923N3Y7_9BACT|nr:M20 family peptidase [Pontibacter cellulosilyticus]MBC5991803.1 M20/M25/M40 family metallo-hydrolase [Pontibacter cellulosilyticus]
MNKSLRILLLFFLITTVTNFKKGIAQHLLVNVHSNAAHLVVDKLAGCIQYETISSVTDIHNNAENFLGLHNYLATAFPLVHQYLTREAVNNYSLLYTWTGTNSSLKPVLISAHLDVVPIESASENDWRHDPFKGEIADGYIWGRGTMDDKYRVIAILEAAERLLQQNYQPERTIYFAFGHDEEVGGYEGAGQISALLESRGVALEAVFDEGLAVAEDIIPGVEEQLALVGTAAKGNLNLKLTVTGEGGHSSMPPLETPIALLSRALVRLHDKPFKPRMIPTTRETVNVLASRMGGKYKFAVRHYGLFENRILKMLAQDQATNALIRTKMAPTILEAGDKYNVLPRIATAIINIRILNGEDINSVIKHVKKSIADDRVQVEVFGKYTPPSPVTPTDTWLYAALNSTINKTFPDALVVPALFPGATDSKHYTNLTPNIFRFAPQVVNRESAKLVHNVNERISVDVLRKCIQFYENLIQTTCGINAAQKFVKKNEAAALPFGVNGE